MITIIGTEYNATYDALEIYVSGCKQACSGCHNPEAQAFGKGKSTSLWLKENRYKFRTGTFRRVWVLGGDLLAHAPHDAMEFMSSLRHVMPDFMELWLWTGSVEDVHDIPKAVLEYCDVVKTGAYKEELSPAIVSYTDIHYGVDMFITLASSNQQLHDLRRNTHHAIA